MWKIVGSQPHTSLTQTNVNAGCAVSEEDPPLSLSLSLSLSLQALECLLHNILRMMLYRILTENRNKQRIFMLTKDQLNQCVELVKDFHECFVKIPHFCTVSSFVAKCGFTILIHYKNAKVKSGSERSSHVRKKFGKQKSTGKIIMITFRDQKGMIYRHVVLDKKINGKKLRVDSQYYL